MLPEAAYEDLLRSSFLKNIFKIKYFQVEKWLILVLPGLSMKDSFGIMQTIAEKPWILRKIGTCSRYAVLGLVSAVINMLTCENDMEVLKDFGSILFKWIVIVNITKDEWLNLSYTQRPLERRPSSVPRGGIEAGEYFCEMNIDWHIKDAMNHLLTLLVTFTQCSTKELAIREQKMSDPETYEKEY